MKTYEFLVMVGGTKIKAYTQSNNSSYAYQKCQRLYPEAEDIHLIRLIRK